MGLFPKIANISYIPHFLRARTLLLAAIFCTISACFSQKPTLSNNEFAFNDTKKTRLPRDYFLLPSPDSKERETLLKLFSAPLLSEELIYKKAESFENYSRNEMQKRKKILFEEYCKLPLNIRRQRIVDWEKEKNRQKSNWASTHATFEASVEYQLQKRLAGIELKSARTKRQTVKKLQLERQMLVEKNWRDYFEKLNTGRYDRGCSDPAEKNSILNIQPEERLYLPYYIALYEFYSYLPDFVRMEMIIQLHSRQ